MYAAIINGRPTFAGLVPVTTERDIEYLVKESEVLTGRPGRKFLIAGAEPLAYRIQWHPNGYQVQRLDGDDRPMCTLYLPSEQFTAHSLGEALRSGQLYTPLPN